MRGRGEGFFQSLIFLAFAHRIGRRVPASPRRPTFGCNHWRYALFNRQVQQAERATKWYQIELGATRLFQRVRLPANQKYFILTVTIAIACGLVAVAYHKLIRLASEYMIERALAVQGPSRVFWIFFVTVGGCLLAGLLLHFFFPD